jgi:hypothetical protein
MSAPFKEGDKVRNKQDGRRATVLKVHFEQKKGEGRKYTRVQVRADPTDRVPGFVNKMWEVEDVMLSDDYDLWARKRGVATEEAPQPAPPDKPQLERPAAQTGAPAGRSAGGAAGTGGAATGAAGTGGTGAATGAAMGGGASATSGGASGGTGGASGTGGAA